MKTLTQLLIITIVSFGLIACGSSNTDQDETDANENVKARSTDVQPERTSRRTEEPERNRKTVPVKVDIVEEEIVEETETYESETTIDPTEKALNKDVSNKLKEQVKNLQNPEQGKRKNTDNNTENNEQGKRKNTNDNTVEPEPEPETEPEQGKRRR